MQTSMSGDHLHEYKDIYFSQSNCNAFENTNVPNNFGVGHGCDFDNLGCQWSRQTFGAGNHNHNYAGSSHGSNAILTSTGGSQPFDNRPIYTVVQYIIYIHN